MKLKVRENSVPILFFIFFLATLLIVAMDARDAKSTEIQISNFHSLQVYDNTHLSRNELSLNYLAPENDSSTYCFALCLSNNQCVAANYYRGRQFKSGSGQCWQFGRIDLKFLDSHTDCCQLAVVPTRVTPFLNSEIRKIVYGQ